MNLQLGLNGFTAGLVLGAVLWSGLSGPSPPPEPRRFSVELTANGSDMSRHGVAALSVKNKDGAARVVTQRCNGACDDLQLKMNAANDGVQIEAEDASGRRVVATSDRLYATGGTTNHVAILGSDKLELKWGVEVDPY